MENKILGRVAVSDDNELKTIGNIKQLNNLLSIYPVKEVILAREVCLLKK